MLALVPIAARLRVALLRASLRRGPGSTARQVGALLGLLVGGGLSVLAFWALAATRGHGTLPQDLAVLLFTAMAVGWVVLPIFTFGTDDLLDPARLALLPLTRAQLLTVMGTGALIGVAPAASAVALAGVVPATARGPASALVGVVAVLLELVLCVGLSRATAAALSGLLRSRRGRDLGVALAALVALSLQLVNPLIQVAARRGAADDVLHTVAGYLRWTPPGLLAAAASRDGGTAALSLLLGAGVVAAALSGWERSVRGSLERPEASGARRRRATSLVPRGLPLPAGRVGAIAAKDLRYLGREPRRLVAALTTTLLPVLAVLLGPLALSGGHLPRAAVFAVCGVALLTGASGGNRFGVEGSAVWVLVSSATDPRDVRRDLLGGDAASAVLTVPVLVALALLIAAATDGWQLVPPALGVALALFAVGLGMSGIVAVTAPYAVPQSQNAFSNGNAGQGCASALTTSLALLAEVLMCLPLLVLLLPVLLLPAPWLGVVLLLVGPAYGVVVGGVLRRYAARRWHERGPEVLQAVTAGSR